jgi:hypothetical protein
VEKYLENEKGEMVKMGNKNSGSRPIDLTGKKFGMLTVLYMAERRGNRGEIYWHCICDCENKTEKDFLGSELRYGRAKTCGCKQKERMSENGKKNKKYNKYDLETYTYGVGFTGKGEEFYFDKEDFDKIKYHYWHISNGYAYTNIKGNTLKMHRVIFGLTSEEQDIHVDHINKTRWDNRKENLRFGDYEVDAINHGLRKDNASGVSGVQYRKDRKSRNWSADIQCKRKRRHLGYYNTFEEAVIARLKAEKELFGEYAPQQHLFEQYGIV